MNDEIIKLILGMISLNDGRIKKQEVEGFFGRRILDITKKCFP
jgi:hypothetical protein